MNIADLTVQDLLWTDWFMLFVVVLTTISSLRRGFLVEFLSISTLAIAFYVSITYNEKMASTFNWIFGGEFLSPGGAMTFGFMGIMFVLSKIKKPILKRHAKKKISITNHLLGSIFGIAKGIMYVSLILSFNGFSVLIKGEDWKSTKVTNLLQPVSRVLTELVIPQNVEDIFQSQLEDLDQNKTFQIIKQDFNIALGWDLKVTEIAEEPKPETKEVKPSPELQRLLNTKKPQAVNTKRKKSDRQILLEQQKKISDDNNTPTDTQEKATEKATTKPAATK